MIRQVCLFLLLLPATAAADDAVRAEFFEQKIRPVLAKQCSRCHGSDKKSSELRVDSLDMLLKGGEHGPAIVPKKADESLLLRVIKGTSDDVPKMPPDKPLAADVIKDFEAWIRDGAFWPETPATRKAFEAERHWAFVPIRDAAPESLVNPSSQHPIDQFIEAARQKRRLAPVADADARTLIRRLSLDLTGLPPAPNEVARFEHDYVGDKKDEVFAKEIDRLLESPRYGERWGRHWMDVVRYADTAGDNADYPVPEVIQYRDYIIDAFHRDKPFDQFVREQIAGDLMPDPNSPETTAERIKATGFLALSRRYATAPYELWHLTLEDTIDTVGKAFLGLTMKCARCHDHKFDPITTNDYYALYGIFDSTQFPWAGGEEFQSKQFPRMHFAPLVAREQATAILESYQASLKQMTAKVAELEKSLATLPEADQARTKSEIETLKRQHGIALRRGYPLDIEAAYAVRDGNPHDVAVQIAGEPGKPGPVVPRGAIAFLSPSPLAIAAGSSGRKELAEWIARPDNPLTARVIVNRLWQHHFGRGIVATSSNFGVSGSMPSHPELLDYLASQLIKNGWSLKSIHRLILTSRTWRLSSSDNESMSATDTGNEFLWRQNRRRLDAEAIRDAFLAVSGRLDLNRPGAHPFPTIDRWNWTQHSQFKEQYDSNHRSVYLMTQRLQRHPFLSLFDGPDTNTTTDVRTSATVATQALYLLNSPEMAVIADSFCERLLAGSSDDRQRIAQAFEICYCRAATSEDLNRCQLYLAQARTVLAGSADSERLSWLSLSRSLLVSNAFFYVD
jgi:uncharacterized protein DUF1553/uncharacterized protein DUF1549/cytochrome c